MDLFAFAARRDCNLMKIIGEVQHKSHLKVQDCQLGFWEKKPELLI